MMTEWTQFKQRYSQEILRADNHTLRRGFVNYTTLAVFSASFLMNKRGYLRYSLRNAMGFYVVLSYLACPENLNLFGKQQAS